MLLETLHDDDLYIMMMISNCSKQESNHRIYLLTNLEVQIIDNCSIKFESHSVLNICNEEEEYSCTESNSHLNNK